MIDIWLKSQLSESESEGWLFMMKPKDGGEGRMMH